MGKDNKATIVIGASPNPRRYSYTATTRLTEAGHKVYPIGIREGEIQGIKIIKGFPELTDIDTITLYISAEKQLEYYDYILKKIKPKRIIFNPGTTNPELKALAKEAGITVINDCTLVMLSMEIY